MNDASISARESEKLRAVLFWHGAAGGAYSRRLEALAEAGVDLTVIVPSVWKEGGRVVRTVSSSSGAYRVVALPALLARHVATFFYVGPLQSLLRRLAPQVVHIDEEPYGLVTSQVICAARRAVPSASVVVETHQNICKRYPPPFGVLEKWTLRNADHFIATSEEIKSVLERKGCAAPVSIVPLGTSLKDFYREEDPELRRELAGDAGFVIGYVGRLVKEKGIDTLLQAAKELQGSWRVLLVGSGPERENLRRLAGELGISERVRFVASLPHGQLHRCMSSMDVLVLPSKTTASWKEQFGRVLVEAMACEVPVIGSSSGEIPFVIGDAGLVFPEGDAKALAACIERLRSHPELVARLKARGLERVKAHYTWERIAQQTVEAYHAAIERRRAARRRSRE